MKIALLVAENIAILIAGWYGRDALEWTQKTIRKHRQVRLIYQIDSVRSRLCEWVIRYYVRGGQEDYIFKLENGKPIAYLTKPAWWNPGPVAFCPENIESPIEVNMKYIDNRRKLGQRIWDGNIYYLSSGISEKSTGCDINLGSATYFQYLTVADRLEAEGRACLRSPRHHPDFRDKVAPTLGHLQSARPGAQLLGFTVAVVMATRTGLCLIFQDRSMKTGVAGGRGALIPAYVCEPSRTASGVHGLPLADFLREFIEELYPSEYDKAEGSLGSDWYYGIHPVPELMDMQKRNEFNFDILGYGFDALTTELHVGAVAFIGNVDFAEREIRRMKRSWEADGIEVIDIDPRTISLLAESERTYATSAFTLMRLKSWIEKGGLLG